METFSRIIVDLGPGPVVVALVVVLLAAVLCAGFALRERRKLRSALDRVQADLSRIQVLNDRLEEQIKIVSSKPHAQRNDQDNRADVTSVEAAAFTVPTLGSIGEKTMLFQPNGNESETYAGFPYLRAVAGRDEGTLHYLQFTRTTIGRDRSNTLPIRDSNSSRWHCEIGFRDHHFVLTDNGSTNGTFCNGERIQECRLDFGDRIKIGDTEMVFSCEGFDLKDSDPGKAVKAFETCLQRQPKFLLALKHLAFLMERDVARQKDAQPIWDRIKKLEGIADG